MRTTKPVDFWVGQRLREARIRSGKSQTVLGEDVGVSFQQIQKYETGANRISAATLFEFAKCFDVPITYFFEGFNDGDDASPGDDLNLVLDQRIERKISKIPDGETRQMVLDLIDVVVRSRGAS